MGCFFKRKQKKHAEEEDDEDEGHDQHEAAETSPNSSRPGTPGSRPGTPGFGEISSGKKKNLFGGRKSSKEYKVPKRVVKVPAPQETTEEPDDAAKVHFFLRCENLRKACRCFVVVYNKFQGDTEWCHHSRTETIEASQFPNWSTDVVVPFYIYMSTFMRFELYRAKNERELDNLEEQQFIGGCEMDILEAVRARSVGDGWCKKNLTNPKPDAPFQGKLAVWAEEDASSKSILFFDICGEHLRRTDFWKPSCDPFLTICRAPAIHEVDDQHLEAYTGAVNDVQVVRSEVRRHTRNPKFKKVRVSTQSICDCKTKQTIIFDVWDWFRVGAPRLVGTGLVCYDDIYKNFVDNKPVFIDVRRRKKKFVGDPMELTDVEPIKPKDRGRLAIESVEVQRTYTLLDFLRSGFELVPIFGVDFTRSTGLRDEGLLSGMPPQPGVGWTIAGISNSAGWPAKVRHTARECFFLEGRKMADWDVVFARAMSEIERNSTGPGSAEEQFAELTRGVFGWTLKIWLFNDRGKLEPFAKPSGDRKLIWHDSCSFMNMPGDDVWNKDNDYAETIESLGSVLQGFTATKAFPCYGFGAKVPPTLSLCSHAFALNGDYFSPEVTGGVERVLEMYNSCLQVLRLHGPTMLNPVLDIAAKWARPYAEVPAEGGAPRQLKYFVLLLITEGGVQDQHAVVKTLVECTALPMSVIIVQVGHEEDPFLRDVALEVQANQELQETGVRNFIHVARFDDFRGNPRGLAHALLVKIPDDVSSYFKAQGVKPLSLERYEDDTGSPWPRKKITNGPPDAESEAALRLAAGVDQADKKGNLDVTDALKEGEREAEELLLRLPQFLQKARNDLVESAQILGYTRQIATRALRDGLADDSLDILVDNILHTGYGKCASFRDGINEVKKMRRRARMTTKERLANSRPTTKETNRSRSNYGTKDTNRSRGTNGSSKTSKDLPSLLEDVDESGSFFSGSELAPSFGKLGKTSKEANSRRGTNELSNKERRSISFSKEVNSRDISKDLPSGRSSQKSGRGSKDLPSSRGSAKGSHSPPGRSLSPTPSAGGSQRSKTRSKSRDSGGSPRVTLPGSVEYFECERIGTPDLQ